ncbi:DNA-packaging protein [Pontibacter sp. H249]|uniref:DNA-packaging protein n=1 Tax=Pontibacter sp. H249 TaxID=3133420 RepID=UPI0030BBB546
MAAPKGNQFWKLRSKHGRDKLFASPDLLWEAACEYFEWCDKHPWIKKDWVGKDAFEVDRPTQRPYTLSGLCLYLDVNTKYFNDFKKAGREDFSEVLTRIEETIYTQKFEGAAVGTFNASIIARDLGLADKKEISGEVETKQQDLSHLSYEQLYELKYGRKPEQL